MHHSVILFKQASISNINCRARASQGSDLQDHPEQPLFKFPKAIHLHSPHLSYNMASLGRNRTMPTDAAVAKFLYTIMKQLDLKSVRSLHRFH